VKKKFNSIQKYNFRYNSEKKMNRSYLLCCEDPTAVSLVGSTLSESMLYSVDDRVISECGIISGMIIGRESRSKGKSKAIPVTGRGGP
jgi:hypothetical protein